MPRADRDESDAAARRALTPVERSTTMMPPPPLTTVYTMPPLYFVPSKWPALAYLQVSDEVNVLVYHSGAQKRLWGDHSSWLADRVIAGDYRQVDSPPVLKGART